MEKTFSLRLLFSLSFIALEGCAMPPAPLYGTRVPATDGTAIDGSTKTIQGTYGSNNSPVTAPTPTSTPTPTPTSTTVVPTCTIALPTLLNVSNTYYVNATLTVQTGASQVNSITFILLDSLGYGYPIQTLVAPPYQVKYPAYGFGMGSLTLSATIFAMDGNSYPAACRVGYTLNY